jgi:tetratricopeptide (TPR) repeat protein
MRTLLDPVAVALALALNLAACSPQSPDAPIAAPASAVAVTPSAAPSAAATVPASVAPARALDWGALRAAEAECVGCHPDQVTAWQASPMGRSLLAYGGERPPTRVEKPKATYAPPRGGQKFTVTLDARGVPTFRDEAVPEAAPRPARYLIGSGEHTRSYLWAEGDALFEAPLTWYPARKVWGASPGYEVADHPGLFREIKPDCLYCHADPAPHVTGSLNRYLDPAPVAIGCTRCHGDTRAHVADRQAGHKTNDPVMPSRLDAARRADVCDQCHLVGAVRLAREGRAFGQYLPGDRLEDTVAIFVRLQPGSAFGIASHGERLRRSRCGEGQLACTQCHAPHAPHGEADRSTACRQCHGETHRTCKGAGGNDCAGCHMHRAQTSDIPHVAMTDHLIRVRPEAPQSAPEHAAGPLVWVAHPEPNPSDPDRRLLLGRAYAESARVGGPDIDTDRQRATELLTGALEALPGSAEGWADLASMQQLAGNRAGLDAAIERAAALAPGDVRISRGAAASRLTAGKAAEALRAVDAGLATEPDSVALRLARANALVLLQRRAEARAAFDHAWSLRPGEPDVLLAKGLLAELDRDADAAAEAYGRATRRAPLHVPARLNHYRLLSLLARWPEALKTIDEAFEAVQGRGQIPPALLDRLTAARALARARLGQSDKAANEAVGLLTRGLREPWAVMAMGVVARQAGQHDASLKFLDQAVSWAPEDGVAWALLAETLDATGKSELAARATAQAERLGARKSAPSGR